MGRYAEAKCLAVNPRRPYQLALGANDFYVRLYDTRMIKLARLQVRWVFICLDFIRTLLIFRDGIVLKLN